MEIKCTFKLIDADSLLKIGLKSQTDLSKIIQIIIKNKSSTPQEWKNATY